MSVATWPAIPHSVILSEVVVREADDNAVVIPPMNCHPERSKSVILQNCGAGLARERGARERGAGEGAGL